MGLIKSAASALGGVIGDQWKEYFYCEAIPADVIAMKGFKKITKRSSNYYGTDNIISNGSLIVVADGQCMLIVDQGKVVEVCAEPGAYVYDTSTEPSIFYGNFGEQLKNTFANMGKRFTFGGDAANDQRIYYINTKELPGNKYGTPNPIPFRVVDKNIGLDIDIAIRCFGEYSYRISDPILFYSNVCGNFDSQYLCKDIENQLKSELLTVLQPAFGKLSKKGVRYSEAMAHTGELAEALNEQLSSKWKDLRGIEIVSFGISSLTADEDDENMIKELQKTAALRDPNMAAARLADAQAEAMQNAAKNESTGPALAFMGLGMANTAGGMNAQNLYQVAAEREHGASSQKSATNANHGTPDRGWVCSCGTENAGKFCIECGKPKPEKIGWECSQCGSTNKGKFCAECGSKKPVGELLYQCDKCGWEPEDPKHPPKFCPECGDPFGEEDIKK